MGERILRVVVAVVLVFSVRDSVAIVKEARKVEYAETEETYTIAESLPPPAVEIPEVVVDKIVEPEEKPVEDVSDSVEVMEYTPYQHEILSIIIYQESGADSCSDDTRRKVGSVFLNRVNSPLFPNTFEEVALGHRQYGTLYITGIKWPDRASLPQEAHAVQRAKDIAEELLISGSILPSNVIWQAEFRQGDGTYCDQDGIYFCYSEVSE